MQSNYSGATPIATGPGVLGGVGHDWFQLRAHGVGRFVVRLRYTRYWTITGGTALGGGACVARAAGGWTAVSVGGPGTIAVRARFSLGRALGAGGPVCRGVS